MAIDISQRRPSSAGTFRYANIYCLAIPSINSELQNTPGRAPRAGTCDRRGVPRRRSKVAHNTWIIRSPRTIDFLTARRRFEGRPFFEQSIDQTCWNPLTTSVITSFRLTVLSSPRAFIYLFPQIYIINLHYYQFNLRPRAIDKL